MFGVRSQRAGNKGRLLNEFLVSLALLFLIMPADLKILSSASKSAHLAGATVKAAEIAQQGIEEAIAQASVGKAQTRTKEFSDTLGTGGEVVFSRTTTFEPLSQGSKILRARVTVRWSESEREVHLERYVAGP